MNKAQWNPVQTISKLLKITRGRKKKRFTYRRFPPKHSRPWNLRLSKIAAEKLLAYQFAAQSFEVGGFVLLEEVPLLQETEMTFSISDLSLVNSGAAAVLASPHEAARQIAKILEAGQEPKRIKGFWHTHPGFSPFWSGADESGIQKMLQTGLLATKTPWALSICATGAWISSRVDWIIDGQQFMSDLNLEPIPGLDPDWFKQVKEIIDSNESRKGYRYDFEPIETHLPIWDQEDFGPPAAFNEESLMPYRYCHLRGADVDIEYCDLCTVYMDCWEEDFYV